MSLTLTRPGLLPSAFGDTMSEAPSRASDVAARWTSVPGGVLDGGEIVILAIKPSLWRCVFDSAAWLAAGAFFATAVLVMGRPIPGLSATASAQVVVLVALARLAVAGLRWTTTWHLLTNRRIVDVQGVRAPVIRSCPLIQVRNTYLRSSFVEKPLCLGSITFVSDEPDHPPHVWQSIANADEVHAKTRRAIENALDQINV
jgi:hypothetical protein